MTQPVAVTVAICTWNRSALLKTTLEGIARTTAGPLDFGWELLVIDNNSTDDTSAVIRGAPPRLPLRSVFKPVPGLSNARNRALADARGEYILFTDDDVLVEETWLASFVAATREHPAAAAFGGPIDPWFPEPPDEVLAEAFPALRRGFCGLPEASKHAGREAPRIWGANMAFRRSALEDLRFDPSLGRSPTSPRGGEEEAVLFKLLDRGEKIVWCPKMKVRHYVDPKRMTLDYLIPYSIASGESAIYMWGAGTTEPLLFGVPRWMVRRLVETWLARAVRRVVGPRVKELEALRDHCYVKGMLRAWKALRSSSREGVLAARPTKA